ncbi:MAG TPA: hypothetical protein VMY43_02715 [Methanothrix sp.]|nr:hypothetical protein [Methanothrix sp.]
MTSFTVVYLSSGSGQLPGRTPLLKKKPDSDHTSRSRHAMTSLMITDIRKSDCDRGFDLVTAIFLSRDGYDASRLKSLDEKSLLVDKKPFILL